MRPRRLPALPPRLTPTATSRVRPPPKEAPAELLTREYRAWRAEVMRRAGYRCEWVDGGLRCTKAAPRHRMFADHVVERRDGGALLDPRNGQCLCGQHHSIKRRARERRGQGREAAAPPSATAVRHSAQAGGAGPKPPGRRPNNQHWPHAEIFSTYLNLAVH
jgi:5-methylcytosine-specific restriction protein A